MKFVFELYKKIHFYNINVYNIKPYVNCTLTITLKKNVSAFGIPLINKIIESVASTLDTFCFDTTAMNACTAKRVCSKYTYSIRRWLLSLRVWQEKLPAFGVQCSPRIRIALGLLDAYTRVSNVFGRLLGLTHVWDRCVGLVWVWCI